MEMHQIRYFLALCHTLNFTRAAEECHVSQPALSRAIRQLEVELGGELLRRERSLTQITDLGRAALPSLRQCYEGRQTAQSLAQSYLKKGHAPSPYGARSSATLFSSPTHGAGSTARVSHSGFLGCRQRKILGC